MDVVVQHLLPVFNLTSVSDIVRFLGSKATLLADWRWVPLGGRDNNAGSINLAVDPGQALVERVTNEMDALIELAFETSGKPTGLTSPRDAVWHLWHLEGTRLTRQSQNMARFIDEMAPKSVVRVLGTSARGQSTVVIQDAGIGQHPDDFPKTILSLGESNKVTKPYLIGAFGQGGSSTFAYCPYSVIVSRRDVRCLGNKDDSVGWTIVRKYDDDSLKTLRYEYLVDPEGRVPRFSPLNLERVGLAFSSGMRITHLGYELGRLSTRWSLVGYRFFDNLLFDPVLPYRIEDTRWSPPFNRNLYGARNRLDQQDDTRHPEGQTFEADLSPWGGEGKVHIRYWVFQSIGSEVNEEAGVKLDSYLDSSNSPRTIIFTLNGQRHYTQEKRLVREARLGAISDYLLMHVDCDDLSRRLKKEIFTANRAGATAGERREDILLNAVREALADPWLKHKMDEIIRRRQSQVSDESSRRVTQMLDRLITVYRTDHGAGGQSSTVNGGTGSVDQRKTHDPPTFLHFADHQRLQLLSGDSSVVYLLTDAPDDFFTRERRPAQLRVEPEASDIASVSLGQMREGRIAINIRVPSTAQVGRITRLVATIDFPPSTFLTDAREMKVIAPPPPYRGVDPPTEFEFARTSLLNVEIGRKATAEINTNAPNDILTRVFEPAQLAPSCDVPGVFVSIRGPRDGVAQLNVKASPDAIAGSTGSITAVLALSDGARLATTRPCTLIAAKDKGQGEGSQRTPVPAYKLERVWRELPADMPRAVTWNRFETPYTADKVGHWEMNGDDLWLYINMNERQFETEQLRWGRQFGEGYATRLRDRYVAYMAFHLFQLYDLSQSSPQHSSNQDAGSGETSGMTYDPDSEQVGNELRRVASTLVQTLRSEASLVRLEGTLANDSSG